jgi:hypothetical protein
MHVRVAGFFFFLGALGWCWIFVVALTKFSIRSHHIVELISSLSMFPKFPMCSQQHQILCNMLVVFLEPIYIGEWILRLIWFLCLEWIFSTLGLLVSQSFITSSWANVAAPKWVAACRLEPITGSFVEIGDLSTNGIKTFAI